MDKYLRNIVSAIVYCYVQQLDHSRKNANYEANYVWQQLMNLPWFFQFPFKVLLLLFNTRYSNLLLRPFYKLEHQRRQKSIAGLEKSRIGLLRDFLKFFRNLSTFAHFAQVHAEKQS